MKKLLVKALQKKFNMEIDDAKKLAKTVEGIFDGKKEIEDMSIDKYSRALFYELQREKLLKIRREEIKENGKFMRKYYWSFDNNMIKEAAAEKKKKEEFCIYKKIPRDAWLAHLSYN